MGYKLTWMYIGTQKVRPTYNYPTPIIRFPFTTNLTDTTNTYTLTSNGASVTTLDWVKCLDCTSGNVRWDVSILPQWWSARVNMFWIKAPSNSGSIYSYGNWYTYTQFDSVFHSWTDKYSWQISGYGMDFNFTRWWLWTHVALVLSSDSRNWAIYINGAYSQAYSVGQPFNTTWTYLCVWAEYYDQAYSIFGWHIADFIVDNTAWTADDIKEYYNSTCSTYWLSPIS